MSLPSSLKFVVPFLLVVSALEVVATGQDEWKVKTIEPDAEEVAEDQVLLPFVFEGFVLDADGVPAAGAAIVSSAGGEAVAGQNGFYHLEVDLSRKTECVQITAVGSGGQSRVASTSLAVSAPSGFAWAGTLSLTVGGSCQPEWLPTFGGDQGALYGVNALTVYDDGSGPALFVGGDFEVAGGVTNRGIAKWDGASWSAPGRGLSDDVRALSVFDDGGGPALYAGGDFEVTYDSGDSFLAKWGCCQPATATFRNAGSNPASLTCIAPVLGASWSGTVDLSTTGHSSAYLYALAVQTTTTLPQGQVLLGSGKIARFGPVPGPLASFSFAVPISAALCGVHLTTQALHFGSVSPFATSNAMDLVIGQ